MDETLTNNVRTTMDRASDQFSDAANSLREKAENLGRRAADKISETRGSAAHGLENAASSIHEKADRLPGGETVHSMAHSTADMLSNTANYMKTHELKDVVTDIEECVKRNPGQSLMAAVFVGFLAGRLFRED